METKDVLAQIRTDVGALLEGGREFVHIPTLLKYLGELEQNVPVHSQAAQLQHQSQFAFHRAVHESQLEMFKSVLETGQTAVNTAILVSGGGTVALLAFVGNLYARTPPVPLPHALITALIVFAVIRTVRRGCRRGIPRVHKVIVRSNKSFQRSVTHRGRTVLAMDCALAGAKWHRWPAAELNR